MDAIVMLRDDHKAVERQFKALEKGDLSVVPAICAALTVHAHLEEAVFYPAVRAEVPDVESDVAEAKQEHHVVTVLIEELSAMSEEDEEYEAKATVLMEMVRHHVEEEEGELFPAVRSALGRNRLVELAEQMEAERAAAPDPLVESAAEAG